MIHQDPPFPDWFIDKWASENRGLVFSRGKHFMMNGKPQHDTILKQFQVNAIDSTGRMSQLTWFYKDIKKIDWTDFVITKTMQIYDLKHVSLED